MRNDFHFLKKLTTQFLDICRCTFSIFHYIHILFDYIHTQLVITTLHSGLLIQFYLYLQHQITLENIVNIFYLGYTHAYKHTLLSCFLCADVWVCLYPLCIQPELLLHKLHCGFSFYGLSKYCWSRKMLQEPVRSNITWKAANMELQQTVSNKEKSALRKL